MKPEKKQQARDLYLHAGLSQTEIANILDIDRKTVYLWMREGAWDKLKTAARQAPSIIQQDLYNHIETINQNIFDREDATPTPQEIEMLRKLTAMTKTMDRQHSGSYMQAFQDLCTFIFKKEPNLARQIMPYADKYIKGTFNNKKMTSEECEEIMQAIKENDDQERIAQKAETEQEVSNAQSPTDPQILPPASTTMGSNGEIQQPLDKSTKPAPEKPSGEKDNQNKDEKFPKPDNSTNGENNDPNNPNPPKKE